MLTEPASDLTLPQRAMQRMLGMHVGSVDAVGGLRAAPLVSDAMATGLPRRDTIGRDRVVKKSVG